MTMTDKKDNKKKQEEETRAKDSDDIFGDMDDVIGDRKAAPVPAPTKAPIKEEEAKTEIPVKTKSHTKLPVSPSQPASDEATTVSQVAEKNTIWLSIGDQKGKLIDDITPDEFILWVYDKLPGMKKKRKLKPEQCNTVRKRIDIFEEVIGVLTRWYELSQSRDRNKLDF